RYEAFTIDHLRILKTIAAKAGSCIQNALVYEQAGKSADTDPLTGLPNSKALASRLEQETTRATRENVPYSLLVMDLNGLKKINDPLGHLPATQVHRAVSDGLRSRLRPYDFLARIGGDEFVVLLPGASATGAIDRRIDLAVAIRSLATDFPNAEVSISIGAAT